MSYPSTIDTLVTPTNSQYMNDPSASSTAIVWALNTAVTALENKVWVTGSAVTTSLDYKTSRLTAKGDILTHDWTNPIKHAAWTNGYMLLADSTQANWLRWAATTAGWTVTSVSVATANGMWWTVATATTTPAITLTTSVNWLVKGNWTAFSAATAWTDYSVPTGTETLTNKTMTTPTLNTPTLNYPKINVWSDANGDMYYRDTGVLVRIPIGSTNDMLNIVWWVPTYSNPFTYTGTVVTANATLDWSSVSTLNSTSYLLNNLSTATFTGTRGSSGSIKLQYSPDNSSWTDIYTLSTAWSVTFPILLRKSYYYRTQVSITVIWTWSSALLTFLQ